VDFGTYVALIVLGWIAIGLPFAAVVKWKKNQIKIKHIIPVVLFGLIDIVGCAMGTLLAPAFLPAIIVVVLGVNFRQGGWPDSPKFASYYKIYILILALTLLPALEFLATGYYRSLPVGLTDIGMVMLSVVGGIIIPALIFAGSDPTNRYGQREPENLIGAGFGFLGAAIGMILSFTAMAIIDVLAIVFIIPALAASVLISLPFILPSKSAAQPAPA
jgi:hypothetical protein